MATTSCNCPTPPGGRVECEPGQAAVCWVDGNGNLLARCFSVPVEVRAIVGATSTGSKELIAWLSKTLAGATGMPNSIVAAALDAKDLGNVAVDQVSSSALELHLRTPDGRQISLNVRLPVLVEQQRGSFTSR